MKKILITVIAGAALALPTTAFAHGGWKHNAIFAKLTGTGSSFSGTTATAAGSITKGSLLDSGTFTASLNTNWSAATSKSFDKGTLACAPSTATLTVAGTTTGSTVSSNLSGKTCSFTKTDGTVVRAFFGKGTADGAGTLAGLDGKRAKLWLLQRSDGTVKGAAWAGSVERQNVLFVRSEREAKQKSGCDGDH